MPRTEKSALHTPASIRHVASQLEEMAVGLRAAALLLDIDPRIPRVEINYQPSLEKGLAALTAWVNDARRACNEERLQEAQKDASVRQIGHVSGGSKKNAKNPAESPMNARNSHE